MKEKETEFRDFMGKPLDFDTLRAWVRSPYTLNERETKAFKQFVKDHGYEHSDFGWFFEVYYRRDLRLSRSEIERLIKLVDEMENRHIMFTCNDFLYMENHLRYITKQLLDKGDDPEYFEVFRDFRTGKTRLTIDYYPEEEE